MRLAVIVDERDHGLNRRSSSAWAKYALALRRIFVGLPKLAVLALQSLELRRVRKVWRQLQREGFDVARYTVARLMKAMGLEGIIRGKPIRTTVSDKAAPCPLDHVNRQFHVPAPNMLWVSDFTYVATWTGFVYVAFVIDTFVGCG